MAMWSNQAGDGHIKKSRFSSCCAICNDVHGHVHNVIMLIVMVTVTHAWLEPVTDHFAELLSLAGACDFVLARA